MHEPPTDRSESLLRRGLLGYRRHDVRRALDGLQQELAHVRADCATLEQRLQAADQELDAWRDRQSQLEDLAVRAHEDAARIEQRAVEHARVVVAKARRAAERLALETQEEARQLIDQTRLDAERRRTELEHLSRVRDQLTAALRTAVTAFDGPLEEVAAAGPVADPMSLVDDVGATVHELATRRDGGRAQQREPLRPATTSRRAEGGRRRLRVAPLGDYADLARFVRELAALEDVDDVFVQTFSGDEAELTVHLAPGATLAGALDHLDGIQLESWQESGDVEIDSVRLVAGAS